MFCTHCGHANPDSANFCGQCGRPLRNTGDQTTGALVVEESPQAAVAREIAEGLVPELSPGTALLVAVRGPNVGARFLLDRDLVTVGRHPDSDIFLDDITVSRRHAQFRLGGGSFQVVDVGSLNGTYVNGVRADEKALETNDEVQVGKFRWWSSSRRAGDGAATTHAGRGGADGYTIGEVLNQLKEEFEDITISKIRFLESEGLIYPDRTESGYRKFTDDDVDRLRFILTAQRDHYLPLKVIREQLERLDAGDAPIAGATPFAQEAEPRVPDRAAQIAQALEAAVTRNETPLLVEPSSPVELTLRELADVTGLDLAQVKALRDYGIVGDPADPGAPLDADDLLAARAARDLLRLGLEARHLRMYRQFVDREVALYEQLVTPLLRQRNPEARRQAASQLERLATLTSRMKRSLLARALRSSVRGG